MPVETIIASAVSDFGVNVKTPNGKEWWNGSSQHGMPTNKAGWAALIPVGKPTVVEYFVTNKGAKRITKVVTAQQPTSNPTPAAPVVQESTKPEPTPADGSPVRTQYGRPLSAYEAEKDVRIHVSGILQAVTASPALAAFSTSREAYVENVKAVTKALLDFAHETIEARKG